MTGRIAWLGLGAALLLAGYTLVLADEARDRDELYEPVYRVSNNVPRQEPRPAATADVHPLDPAIELAKQVLSNIHHSVRDYTCTLIKREHINGKLLDHEFVFCKIRNEKIEGGQVVVPFSVYMRFLKPDHLRGQEVLYVAGENGNKLVARPGGIKGRFTPAVSLVPTSFLAMKGNKYPITEIGIENLSQRLIERAERDRRFNCDVRILENTRVGQRSCRCIEVTHQQPHPQLDFYQARVFVDNELQMPIRYEAYSWPKSPAGTPELIEEYTYMDLKVNVGLTDYDFNQQNKGYNF